MVYACRRRVKIRIVPSMTIGTFLSGPIPPEIFYARAAGIWQNPIPMAFSYKFTDMRLALLVLFCFFCAACNNTATTASGESHAEPRAGEISSYSGCYLRVLGRDSFAVHLQQTGTNITGKLSFDNFEKDASTGTVRGKLEGNRLRLIYSFQSEGMNSVMEVIFRADSHSLIRGIGALTNHGDTVLYKQPDSLSFPGTEKWLRLPCDSLPAKFR